jgi:hypothetical protein
LLASDDNFLLGTWLWECQKIGSKSKWVEAGEDKLFLQMLETVTFLILLFDVSVQIQATVIN